MARLILCKLTFLMVFTFILTYYIIFRPEKSFLLNDYSKNIENMSKNPIKTTRNTIARLVLSFVVCDTRFSEALNVIKSALTFTKTPVYFVIFTNEKLTLKFNNILSKWKILSKNQLDFELQRIKFPETHEKEWMNLFSKCAAQRLFIPMLLPHIDALIYVDTDTLFLGPVEELWQFFYKFNSSQMSAMTLEDDNPNVSWYPRFAKHPYYGKYGLNSGIMLMNLTRMRAFGWENYVTPIMLKWKLDIPWGDQDIINIIFHYHAEAVAVLPCRYNYRTDQCVYGPACPGAALRGVHLLHGSRAAFHNDKQPIFQAVYRAIDEHQIGTDPSKMLIALKKYLSEVPPSNCGSMKDAFSKVPIKTISEIYGKPTR